MAASWQILNQLFFGVVLLALFPQKRWSTFYSFHIPQSFRWKPSDVLPPAFQVDPVNFRTERWGNLKKIKNPNPIFQSNWWCRLSRECGIADWSHGGRRQRIELVLHAKLRMHLLISIRSVASWSWASATSNGSKIKRFEPGFLRMWILKLHDFMGH